MDRRQDFGRPRLIRIYCYILTHDTGMAPCPENGLITLGTCKPVIRRVARPGDWILGFRPGSRIRGLVLWAGKVERSITHGEYQRGFPKRSDAAYRLATDGQYERLIPDYHPSQAEMARDTDAPVLLFDSRHSYYFNGVPELLPEDLAHLAAAGRGHRVTEASPRLSRPASRNGLETLIERG
jgi:hypothetical protein